MERTVLKYRPRDLCEILRGPWRHLKAVSRLLHCSRNEAWGEAKGLPTRGHTPCILTYHGSARQTELSNMHPEIKDPKCRFSLVHRLICNLAMSHTGNFTWHVPGWVEVGISLLKNHGGVPNNTGWKLERNGYLDILQYLLCSSQAQLSPQTDFQESFPALSTDQGQSQGSWLPWLPAAFLCALLCIEWSFCDFQQLSKLLAVHAMSFTWHNFRGLHSIEHDVGREKEWVKEWVEVIMGNVAGAVW